MSDINDAWHRGQDSWGNDGSRGEVGEAVGEHPYPPTVQIPRLGLEEEDTGRFLWRWRDRFRPDEMPVDNWSTESPWGHKFMPSATYEEYHSLATFCTPWRLNKAIRGSKAHQGGLNTHHMHRLFQQVGLAHLL